MVTGADVFFPLVLFRPPCVSRRRTGRLADNLGNHWPAQWIPPSPISPPPPAPGMSKKKEDWTTKGRRTHITPHTPRPVQRACFPQSNLHHSC